MCGTGWGGVALSNFGAWGTGGMRLCSVLRACRTPQVAEPLRSHLVAVPPPLYPLNPAEAPWLLPQPDTAGSSEPLSSLNNAGR